MNDHSPPAKPTSPVQRRKRLREENDLKNNNSKMTKFTPLFPVPTPLTPPMSDDDEEEDEDDLPRPELFDVVFSEARIKRAVRRITSS
jgi:hypothetical protein